LITGGLGESAMRFSIVWCICVALPALVVVGACSKEGEPPPPNNVVLSHGSMELPPVPLARPDDESLPPVSSARYLKKIAGPAGNPAEVGTEKAGAKPADAAKAIALNDAEAESLMKQFVELSNAGKFEATTAMFVQDQQATVRKLAVPMTALAKNLARLRNALKDTAADVAKQLQPDEKGTIILKSEDGTDVPIQVPPTGVEAPTVTPQGDDKATATVRAGAQGPEQKLELERVDGKWRIREPNMPSSPEQVAAAAVLLDAAAKTFGEVADKVEKNEIQPADTMKELVAALKRAMEAARTAKPEAENTTNQESPPAGSTSADNAATADKPSAATPARRSPRRRPGESASGRDVNNEAPTLEESLGHQ
jgi:hypothetical protein